ncbi:MAG: mannose-1-phosphate guanylyltransferase/mannose-6-phosphate isomerase [Nitrospirae bacterium]|nr:mannose-1-phosphate guanylyltransferase/mannose-6-phosphate isomerase [Nitrospirota bacterium]
MKALILAGGGGTRLWPLSRKNYPKQFLKIDGGKSLLQQTAERLLQIVTAENIVVMTNNAYKFYVKSDLADLNNIILGVKPDKPETGYGYIKAGKGTGKDKEWYKVEKFTEKPDAETAKRYMDEGSYFWNSGMFAFSIKTIVEELGRYAPEIRRMFDALSFEEMLSGFGQMPDISIDYAVMEKSDRAVVMPLDLYWNDIGSWDSLYDVLDKDEHGNVKKGDVLTIDTQGTLIFSNKRHISTIGIEDCLIVETDDAILIAKKGEAQKVKDIVSKLKEDVRTVADEHVTTHRPWGSYTILEDGPRYKIKRIVVKPNEKLSLQMHYHRSEHWVVVKGTAKVTVGDREMFIHENESAYVPKSTLHRLENPGKVHLEIIEVQNGEYVGEDDIVRIDDKYER